MNKPQTTNYHALFKRMLYDSLLHSWWGKLIFTVILLITLYWAGNVWSSWLTPLSNGWLILFAVTIAFFGSSIGLASLCDLGRRDPEPWWYWVHALFIALLLTTAPAAYVNSRSLFPMTIGFNVAFWKVLPLLLLVFFAPTAVSGTRGGLIYGALGGFRFNITEIANYFWLVAYPAEGIKGLSGQLVRLYPAPIGLAVQDAKDDGEHRPGHG